MHLWVLVLKNAHLLTRANVELTVLELIVIYMLAKSFMLGTIAQKLDKKDDTINHIICRLYEKTGAGTHPGLVSFGFVNQFLRRENGDVAIGWEDKTEVQWEWRQRKYGEGR